MPPQILPQSIGTIFRTRKPPLLRQQVRHATLIKRHKRPYTFTQLVTLSDGSAFLHRTTSPAPIHRSNKDVRNSIMWNPSSKKLLNVEEDEAGRLRAFRARFGRGWDAAATPEEGEMERAQSDAGTEENSDSLMDLIGGGFSQKMESSSGMEKLKAAAAQPKKKTN